MCIKLCNDYRSNDFSGSMLNVQAVGPNSVNSFSVGCNDSMTIMAKYFGHRSQYGVLHASSNSYNSTG